MFKEFKEFALKGSVLDLAIAVILAAAFGAVVNSLVKDIIMPPIGMALGGVNFNDLFINLSGGQYDSLAAATAAGAATINYGVFINTIITFIIVAFVLYLIVRWVNSRRAAVEATTRPCAFCAEEIAIAASRCPHCTSELAPAPTLGT